MATPDINWLPKHMSATLQLGDTTLSSVTPSPGSVVGTQPGYLKPLVHKITSGAAHTATELKETLEMGVCIHTIRDTLKQERLVSKVKVNRPVPSKSHQSTG